MANCLNAIGASPAMVSAQLTVEVTVLVAVLVAGTCKSY